jgi:hypothetical protein
MKPQQPDGESRLQPVHPRDQVRLRRLKGEVKVIPHHDVRVHLPAEFSARLPGDADKGAPRAGRNEKVVLEVAAVEHLVPRAGRRARPCA